MKPSRSITLSRLLTTPYEYWIGCLYYKRDRWARADRQFAAALKRRPSHGESLFQRGMVEFKREQWEKAYEYMHAAITLEPERTKWMVQFCQAARHLGGSNSSAVEICTKHIEERISENPSSADLYSELAKIYRIQGRVWLEIESLKKAGELIACDAALIVRLGQSLEKMKRYSEAADAYELAVKRNPAGARYHYRAGLCVEMARREGLIDPERMAGFYAQAIANDETGESKRFGIGVFHQNGGHWKLAAEAYRRQLAHHPDDLEVLYRLGMCHDRLYQWGDAERCYSEAVAAKPDEMEWWTRLGFVRERQAKFGEAAECYERVARSNGSADPMLAYRLAYSLDMTGEHEAACTVYAKIDPNAAPYQAAGPEPWGGSSWSIRRIRTWAATCVKGVTDRSRTAVELQSKLRKDATHSETWSELGLLLENTRDWRGAVEAYRQAASRSASHNARYQQDLGRALWKVGGYQEACEAFRNMRILRRNHGAFENHFWKNTKYRRQASYVEYSEVLPLQDKTVLFECFHGRLISCNPYALFLHMLGEDEYSDWNYVWVINDRRDIPARLRGLENVIYVPRDSDAYLRYLATAKLLINNVTFPSYFMRRDGQFYLNTWHGTPWKTLGKDVKNEFLIHGNVSRNFLQMSHIASPNRYTSDILINSYGVAGLYKGSVLETGSPRIDLTIGATDQQRNDLRKSLGIESGRKVVLFAPTWRGTLSAPYHEVSETVDVIKRLAGVDCHVLFRGHYFVQESLELESAAGCVVPDEVTTNELLSIVDVLVTDYSSVFFDFLPTGKPVVFHLSDHENYRTERGLYFDLDELPGEVVTNADDLCSLLSNMLIDKSGVPHPGYAAAVRKYCSVEDGSACKRVLDFVFSGEKHALPDDGKRTILMFGGHFQLNGITIALINLLKNLDYSRTRLALVVDTGSVSMQSDSRAYLESLPREVQLIPRAGAMNTTLEERWVLSSFNRKYRPPETEEAFEGFRLAHAREVRRMFGGARFDAAIEYSGYSGLFAALFGCADREIVRFKAIYQHNEMQGEWKTKYPTLERVFSLYRFFDRLVSVSRVVRDLNMEHLAEEFDLPPSKFVYAENLVDADEIIGRSAEALEEGDDERLFSSGRKVFLTIGRLSVEKDHEKLIRAFARLCETRSDVMLVILGDGPLSARLGMLVRDLKLDGSVYLIGYRFNPFPYLKKADCFVFSSNYEGQGLVLLEAMILERPIVSVDIEVCRGVVEDRSGVLVENSIGGLLDGMKQYLNGEVSVIPVDFENYRKNSLRMFYQKSCGFIEEFNAASEETEESEMTAEERTAGIKNLS